MENQNETATVAVAKINTLGDTLNGFGLEKETSVTLLARFTPLLEKAEEWKRKAEALVVTDVSQVCEMQEARTARLALKDIRVAADKERKALKEDSLRYGKAVQGVYNVIEFLIAPIEEYLQNQEDFAKIQAAKVIAELQEQRAELVAPLQDFIPYGLNLGTMASEDFEKLINGAKLQQEQHAQQLIAEREAEAEGLREVERQRLENIELKAKAEQAEKQRLLEKQKAYAILMAERERADELLEAQRKEAARVAKVAADKLAALTAEKNRLQAEEKARVAKVEAEEKARVENDKKLAAAPDKIKLLNAINSLTFEGLELYTNEGAECLHVITSKFEAFKNWAKIQVNNL